MIFWPVVIMAALVGGVLGVVVAPARKVGWVPSIATCVVLCVGFVAVARLVIGI